MPVSSRFKKQRRKIRRYRIKKAIKTRVMKTYQHSNAVISMTSSERVRFELWKISVEKILESKEFDMPLDLFREGYFPQQAAIIIYIDNSSN